MGAITHIVLFALKYSATEDDAKDLSRAFLALTESCLHPKTNQQYILSIKGGTDNSPENNSGGLTHAFIVEFASKEDRDYYLDEDPVHAEFKERAGRIVEKATVVDFEANIFA